MQRFGLEIGKTRGHFDQLVRKREIHINQLSALRAERVVVAIGFRVEFACSIAELNFGDVPGLLQIPQRVIDGRKADRRQKPFRLVENLVGGQVMLGRANDLKHYFALFR